MHDDMMPTRDSIGCSLEDTSPAGVGPIKSIDGPRQLKLDAFLAKYGTDGASIIIQQLVRIARADPANDYTADLADEVSLFLGEAFRELKGIA